MEKTIVKIHVAWNDKLADDLYNHLMEVHKGMKWEIYRYENDVIVHCEPKDEFLVRAMANSYANGWNDRHFKR